MVVVTSVYILKKWTMSDLNKTGREEWLRGKKPAANADDFTRHAARGREELASETEAKELITELDGLFAARFGEVAKHNDEGAAAGAKEAASQGGGQARIRKLERLYVVAAAILLLVAAGSWWITQTPTYNADVVFADAFTPYPNDLIERTMGGEDAPADNPLNDALLAYDRGEFGAAATAFEGYFLAPPTGTAPATAPKTQLYYGISLLGAGRAATAIPVLAALRNDPANGPPATWYHALALLRDGQTKTAHASLIAISQDNTSPFQQQALKLLPRIPY